MGKKKLARLNTSKIKLVTFHHNRADLEFLAIVMNDFKLGNKGSHISIYTTFLLSSGCCRTEKESNSRDTDTHLNFIQIVCTFVSVHTNFNLMTDRQIFLKIFLKFYLLPNNF